MRINIISESVFFPKGHGVHTAFLNQKSMLSKSGQTIYVNSFKKSDITHIHTLGPFSFFKLFTSSPVVVSAHIVPDSLVGSIIGIRYWMWYLKLYLRFFYNKANVVVAVSPEVKKELRELGVTSKIVVLPNSIDETLFKSDSILKKKTRKQLSIDIDATIVLGVGQIQSRKGIADFIEVAKQFPKLIFVWVGGSPFGELTSKSPELTNLLKNPPTNFKLITTIFPYSQMAEMYNMGDIFFFPSYQETFGLVIIEAASCGLPLILRDLPEYELTFKDNYLKGKTNNEFVEKIAELTSKEKREYWAKRSKYVADEFSYEANSQKLLALYSSLLPPE